MRHAARGLQSNRTGVCVMKFWRESIAIALVFCLFQLSVIQSLKAAVVPDPAALKQQLDLFGSGAKLELTLADGRKLRGSVEEIDRDGFLFLSRKSQPAARIEYGQLTGMKLTQRRYRASGHPDSDQARRVVLALGVGKHVVVNATGG